LDGDLLAGIFFAAAGDVKVRVGLAIDAAAGEDAVKSPMLGCQRSSGGRVGGLTQTLTSSAAWADLDLVISRISVSFIGSASGCRAEL